MSTRRRRADKLTDFTAAMPRGTMNTVPWKKKSTHTMP